MKVVISGGGTGGHIMPAIAIGKEMRLRGCKILYIGNKNSLEERIAKKNDFEFARINVQKLYRYFTFKHLLFPIKLIISIISAIGIIKKFKPDLFIGTGGFVIGPVGLATKMMKVPIFLQEQNSFPGLTTRKLAKFAEIVFLGNQGAARYLINAKTHYCGNPIQMKYSQKKNYDKFSLDNNKKSLLIIGGSQGSNFINKLIEKHLVELSQMNINIIWQVGEKNKDKFNELEKRISNLYLFGFSYQMHLLYAISDFAICRAGAISLAELEEMKIPSLLIPLPNAAGNHQKKNAEEFEKRGLGIYLEQHESDFFMTKLNFLLSNENDFRVKFKDSKHQNATKEIVDLIIKNCEVK